MIGNDRLSDASFNGTYASRTQFVRPGAHLSESFSNTPSNFP